MRDLATEHYTRGNFWVEPRSGLDRVKGPPHRPPFNGDPLTPVLTPSHRTCPNPFRRIVMYSTLHEDGRSATILASRQRPHSANDSQNQQPKSYPKALSACHRSHTWRHPHPSVRSTIQQPYRRGPANDPISCTSCGILSLKTRTASLT